MNDADQAPCRCPHQIDIEIVAERPAPASQKRRTRGRPRSHPVCVPPGHRVVPRVEVQRDLFDRRHPDVGGEDRIQGPLERARIPPARQHRGRDLARRMHARVGPAGAQHARGARGQLLERLLQLALHRACIRLRLPAVEPGTIVMKREFESAIRRVRGGAHGRKTTAGGGRVNHGPAGTVRDALGSRCGPRPRRLRAGPRSAGGLRQPVKARRISRTASISSSV